jgi:hypothetical protein
MGMKIKWMAKFLQFTENCWRNVLEQKYKEQIDSLYEDSDIKTALRV